MLEEALSRLIEGVLSGIGIGFIFYLYPVVRHTLSEKYRYKFRFEEDGKIKFRNFILIYLPSNLIHLIQSSSLSSPQNTSLPSYINEGLPKTPFL